MVAKLIRWPCMIMKKVAKSVRGLLLYSFSQKVAKSEKVAFVRFLQKGSQA